MKTELTMQEAMKKLRVLFDGRAVAVQNELFFFDHSGELRESWSASVFSALGDGSCISTGDCSSLADALERAIVMRFEADRKEKEEKQKEIDAESI